MNKAQNRLQETYETELNFLQYELPNKGLCSLAAMFWTVGWEYKYAVDELAKAQSVLKLLGRTNS